MKHYKKTIINTSMLMIFNIAKIIFPFITLPYLTRIFSTDTFGVVSYVKTVMLYMQIIIDFGFMLSVTKNIVDARDDRKKISEILGDTLLARMLMGIIAFIILILLMMFVPILRENILFTLLSFLAVFMSIFLMDYLFKGLEIMHIVTIRFILMKTISTILTFVFVKNNNDILLIPILDIISTLIAIILVFYNIRKQKISFKFTNLNNIYFSIKQSFVYFLSTIASTSFNALSTLLIGLMITTTEVAYWTICIQIIGTIQNCYTPFSEGIYPEMIKSKNINNIKKILKIFLPVVSIGCLIMFIGSKPILLILGGSKYLEASLILKILVPTLFFSFLVYMLGWPTLGVIGKEKETTKSTIYSIIINMFLLFFLLITNSFTLINIAIVRVITELFLFLIRLYYTKKYIYLFNES